MRVLVMVPRLERRGGIANYYRVVRPHFTIDVDYLWRGSRSRGQPGRNLLWHVYDYLAFCCALSRRRYSIVHINTSISRVSCLRDGLYILLARLLGARVLVFFRGWSEEYLRHMGPAGRVIFHFTFLRADLIVVLARELARKLAAMGYPAARIRTDTTVVDAAIADEMSTPCERVRPQPDDGLELLFLSRVERAKGIYQALEVFERLKRSRPSLRLTVAGDGSELDGARRHVHERQLSDVVFLGHVSGAAKRNAFLGADLFLFPSHAEGMPNAVLEAMGAALPVVGRAVGGLPDFFENGRMGYLTESMDVEVLSDLCDRLLADDELRQTMGAYNAGYAHEHFSADRVVERLELLYQEIAAGKT